MRKEIADLRSQNAAMKAQITDLIQEVDGAKTSTQYISDQYDDYAKRLSRIEKQPLDNSAIKNLESKIDNLEQHARQCNIEIANMPEKRGENLVMLLEDIGKNIDLTIPRDEIVSIHRVPHAAVLANDRPKNVIAKLKTRSLRDNILSAFRLKKGLSSTQLGISGPTRVIYVNEHLTLQKKLLLRETREEAKKHGFKYVWVRHATILVKKTDTCAALAIKSSNDLLKMKAN
ncbi:uncharacterized protein LOC113500817 [Trichoplusia ni]|uniref:Uncharacterized protein LOC113500817 n=1 Tax=Trichoplusia ni TaxID=7111 RepID=A0A7E5WA40_TRINI|nr:uncharacterized protein LOC113500817 [Trichoplusia ni]